MRKITLEPSALAHISIWIKDDIKMLSKIFQLIDNTVKTPFEGLGKPEPLKGNYAGYWSRRITQEHRMIYKVENDAIIVISLHGHY